MAKVQTVPLMVPLERKGAEPVARVELRRPTVGDLRGLMLAQVQMQDVNALVKLLPRITKPHLDETDVAALDPADFAALANRVSGFFVTEAAMRAAGMEGKDLH